MRFFTDHFFSEAQKAELLEHSHLVKRHSIKVDEQEILPHRQEPVFYMEWQQDESQQAPEPDSGSSLRDMNLPAVLMALTSGLCMLFALVVLLI